VALTGFLRENTGKRSTTGTWIAAETIGCDPRVQQRVVHLGIAWDIWVPEGVAAVVASGMFLFAALALALFGCRSFAAPDTTPPPEAASGLPPVVVVPGAPAACRASWVFAGPAPPSAEPGAPFQQYAGVLEGAAFGACTLMGPTSDGDWLWVLMSFEPGFRGALRCSMDGLRSAHLQVGPSELALSEGIKATFALMDLELAAARIIPSEARPCPVEAD